MPMNQYIVFFLAILISACSVRNFFPSETSKRIWEEIEANDHKIIDFSRIGEQGWTKVCFLGAYNEDSQTALGFDWQIADHTKVLRSDGHDVIIFATDTKVIEYVLHPRRGGDFSNVSGKCFSRDKSKLTSETKEGSWGGWKFWS